MKQDFQYENCFSKPEKFGAKEIMLGIGGSFFGVFGLWVLTHLVVAIDSLQK